MEEGIAAVEFFIYFLSALPLLTFSGQSTRICALEGIVEVAKVHIFVQSGI
jgi:hypothetical protein